VSLAMIAPTLLDCASPEFLAEHMPRIIRGEEKWIQLLSEPSGGSDLAGVLTRATQDGDEWVINGSKVWSTDATSADYGLCLARNDFDLPKHHGLTMFALPLRAPGVTINRIAKSDGWDQEFCQEFFDDVRLGPDAVVGQVNEGWPVAQRLLVHERNTTGGVGYGVGLHPKGKQAVSIDDLLAAVATRGTAISQADEQLLAEAYVNSVVLDQLSERIMTGFGTGALTGPWGSLLKLGAGLRNHRRAEIAIELCGPAAVAWEDGSDNGPVGSAWLNAMVVSVAGGTNEMQRNTVTERLLGLPREPADDRGISFSESLRRRLTANT
jgi:alkylation response protein AidB-like acyl-CoA dehydrogenase